MIKVLNRIEYFCVQKNYTSMTPILQDNKTPKDIKDKFNSRCSYQKSVFHTEEMAEIKDTYF